MNRSRSSCSLHWASNANSESVRPLTRVCVWMISRTTVGSSEGIGFGSWSRQCFWLNRVKIRRYWSREMQFNVYALRVSAAIDTRHRCFRIASDSNLRFARSSLISSAGMSSSAAKRSASTSISADGKVCITICPTSCASVKRTRSHGLSALIRNNGCSPGAQTLTASNWRVPKAMRTTIPPAASTTLTRSVIGPDANRQYRRTNSATRSGVPNSSISSRGKSEENSISTPRHMLRTCRRTTFARAWRRLSTNAGIVFCRRW